MIFYICIHLSTRTNEVMSDFENYMQCAIEYDLSANATYTIDQYTSKRIATIGIDGIQPLMEQGDQLILKSKMLSETRAAFIADYTAQTKPIPELSHHYWRVKADEYYDSYLDYYYEFLDAMDAVIESMDVLYREACLPIVPDELQIIILKFASEDNPICLNRLRLVNRSWNGIIDRCYEPLYRSAYIRHQKIRNESYNVAESIIRAIGIYFNGEFSTNLERELKINDWTFASPKFHLGLTDLFKHNITKKWNGELEIKNLNRFFDPWYEIARPDDQTPEVLNWFKTEYGRDYLVGYYTFCDALLAMLDHYRCMLTEFAYSDSDSDSF